MILFDAETLFCEEGYYGSSRSEVRAFSGRRAVRLALFICQISKLLLGVPGSGVDYLWSSKGMAVFLSAKVFVMAIQSQRSDGNHRSEVRTFSGRRVVPFLSLPVNMPIVARCKRH